LVGWLVSVPHTKCITPYQAMLVPLHPQKFSFRHVGSNDGRPLNYIGVTVSDEMISMQSLVQICQFVGGALRDKLT
jgi:hypothetical protein